MFYIVLQYFKKHDFIYATDPEKRSKTGDIVLIQNLPKKLTRVITHKVCFLYRKHFT